MVLNIKQSIEVRKKNYHRIINRKIQNYIKNPKGNLNLSGIGINMLPNDLKYIDGYLDISFTNISELPTGLVIESNLDINHASITELPEDIVIYGHLWCYETPLADKYSAEEIKSKYNIKGIVWN